MEAGPDGSDTMYSGGRSFAPAQVDYAFERDAALRAVPPGRRAVDRQTEVDAEAAYINATEVEASGFDDDEDRRPFQRKMDADSNELGQQLIDAARDGDVQLLHDLLSAGAPPDRRAPSNGATALHYCAQRGCVRRKARLTRGRLTPARSAAHEASMLLARGAHVRPASPSRRGASPARR